MIKLLFLSILLTAGLLILSSPVFMSLCYSLYAILQPKYIWPYEFPNFSFSLIAASISLMASFILIMRKKSNIAILQNKSLLYMFLILCLFVISDKLSPFPIYHTSVQANVVIDSFITIFVMYIVQLIIISHNPNKNLKFYMLLFALVAIYYAYWANEKYITHNWSYFKGGRLMGPFGGPYSDENALSLLMAMAVPFFLIPIMYLKKNLHKLIVFTILIAVWHSIFLFGSRGAFLATIAATLLSFSTTLGNFTRAEDKKQRNRLKRLKLVFIVIFGIGVLTQADTLLNRTEETASAAKSHEDTPINPRIVSWGVAKKMTFDYPLLGVGTQRFEFASSILYPGESPHVAHNTLLNFTANTGIFAGIVYLLLLLNAIRSYFYCKKLSSDIPITLKATNDILFVSLVAFTIGSIFLDLIIFEPFYFILMLTQAKHFIFNTYRSPKD